MSKSIKVSEEVYQELRELQVKHETFSQLLERLLQAIALLIKVAPIIRGQQELLKQQSKGEGQPK